MPDQNLVLAKPLLKKAVPECAGCRAIVDPNRVFAWPLLKEAAPHHAHRSRKTLLLLFMLIGLVFAAYSRQNPPVQKAALTMASTSAQRARQQFPQQAWASQFLQPWRALQNMLPWQSLQQERAVASSMAGSALASSPWAAGRLGRQTGTSTSALPFQPGALSEFVNTNAGVQMPRLIYTTVLQEEGTEDHVQSAVRAGFQGIQTAGQPKQYYEPGLGAALALLFESGVSRESLFIQTSVNPDHAALLNPNASITQQVKLSIANSLSNLGLEYVDSLLLDLPYPDHDQTMEAWRAMEQAVRAGWVRQLGLSNVETQMQLRVVYRDAELKPAVVQVERFSGSKREMQAMCTKSGIHIQSFLTRWDTSLFEKMQDFSQKYGVTPSMVFFRFLMGMGIVPLTATFSDEKMRDDTSAYRVPLALDDAREIYEVLKQNKALEPEPEEFNSANSLGASGHITKLSRLNDLLFSERCADEHLVVIKFYAKWCRSCKAIANRFEWLAKKYPDARFFEVDYGSNKELCKSLGISTLPYVQIYRCADVQLEGFSCGPSKMSLLSKKLETYSQPSEPSDLSEVALASQSASLAQPTAR